MDENKARIRNYFGRFFQISQLQDSDDIFAAGYATSLFAMQLIAWLEKEFDLAVEDEDLQIGNFNSVGAIAEFIRSKLTNLTPA
jgi:methoxymalonate biosynthesis acyl carrier protein